MSLKFHDTDQPISETLLELTHTLPTGKINLRQLIEHIGEQGLLFLIIVLCLPFLLPVSLPGLSTVFSILIVFIAIGVVANRIPWFPARLLAREFETLHLKSAFEKGAHLLTRMNRFLRPRLFALTKNSTVNRFNGLCLLVSGLLLMLPLSFVPFSNTLPAWAILLITLGMLQRDGLFIVLSYFLTVGSIVYFGALVVIASMGLIAIT